MTPVSIMDDLKVVDFSWLGVGPTVCKYLADFGAEVIRIEATGRHAKLDLGRGILPPFKDNIPGVNRGALWTTFNTSKYGITLNLKHPKGLEIAKRLVARADVAAESFTPGTMRKLGLSYEDLVKV